MKKFIAPISLVLIIFAIILSCDKLAEEDTPVCKSCHSIIYKGTTDTVVSYEDTLRLCGGDVITWENMSDITTDSTTEKHYCID
ncbi:MAG: hypothetical protein A2W91_11445 [Bacteroidetes bacterium GWF2_38_335]|nr:MAG: hypothetical protein A2W91_11445 [Bacteroidetes bacterium GWF2_38_335]OFY81689.1 MAG: hypothetical protein A2281_05600 [Bacteroidetes bacterium RIFOXYA12_FULL_38_20]HBS87753.1 hypothetical protein [Bacteroidales bacterium]